MAMIKMKLLLPSLMMVGASMLLAGCFTGVEGTKKIELNRQQQKESEPSQEDIYISDIKPLSASMWESGKEFYVIDDRAAMIFDRRVASGDDADNSLVGKVLRYTKTTQSATASGESEYQLIFTDGRQEYIYHTGVTNENGRALPASDEMPMMVDKSLVENLNNKLQHKQLWIRTPLWHAMNGESIRGRKYIAVTVDSVTPGERVYPVKVNFTANDDATQAFVYLTFGIAGIESRSFASQFSLTDIHKDYPKIEDNIWALIQMGDVKEGMTKDECRLSLGNPYDVGGGHNTGYVYDVWQYADGTYLVFQDGILQRFQK
jgi:hypothetical protein